MNDATLLRAGGRPLLRFERHLPRPVADVWAAVTEPDGLATWFPTRMELEGWHVGATITHHFDGTNMPSLPGEVLAFDPPRRVSFTWSDDVITFELSPHPDGGTIFVLTEELSARHVARNAAGWESCLQRLERGIDTFDWPARFAHYVAVFGPDLGAQEGPPAGHDT